MKNNNWRKYDQDNEIEQWVTDAFYSYFPSFSERREEKAREMKKSRQKEYNDYLKTIPEPISKKEELSIRREQEISLIRNNKNGLLTTDTESQDSHSAQTVRNTKKTDLPIVLNINMADKSFHKIKEPTKNKRKLYQQQLMRQIEKKKRDLEKLEEKEIEEEDKYIRRLENQLALLELEEKYIKRKKSVEKAKLQLKLNKTENSSELSLENLVKTQTSNELSSQPVPKPYSFFSNSSRHSTSTTQSNSNNNNLTNVSISDDDLIILPDINRYQYCKKCRSDIDASYFTLIENSSQSDKEKRMPQVPNDKMINGDRNHFINNNNNKLENICSNCSVNCKQAKNSKCLGNQSDDGNISDVVFGKKIDLAALSKTPKPRFDSQRLPKMVTNEQNTFKPIIFLPPSQKKMNGFKKTMLPQKKFTTKPIQTYTEIGAFKKQIKESKLSASD